jgi:hypothetical protein
VTLDFAAELRRSLFRAGLIGVILASWSAYALKVPVSAGTRALKAALAKKDASAKSDPAKPSAASVSWVNGGAPIDAATMASIKKEAEAGVAGPAVQGFIEEARKRGDLDKAALPNGMSYAQVLRRAQELSDQANAKPHDLGLEPADRKPGDDDPSAVVPQALELLRSPNAGVREEGAMMLIDNRWAKSERAVEAVPILEGMIRAGESSSGFAELALKRIRFWEAKRRAASPAP